ncbi:TIGR01244 family sulfur transferase [Pseudokordiimonas caeni]|uniref:TIGR01244 family sulfur transferase n=1 Tax=Pseudokordiimonas caeni TaxID=2997908 RepID=UPI002812870D|nr:TIGR01244 family sulfur transferase [Pseudokordiimonas caeni]
MDIRKIGPGLSVSPQIREMEIGILAAQGFKGIVCNRPDGEEDDQPASAALQAAAERHGLAWRNIPVVSGAIADKDVTAFREALAELEGPVLAFCRTGTRSATLWALAEAGHLSVDAILSTVHEAGYDLSGQRERLQGTAARRDTDNLRKQFPKTRPHDVVIVGGGAAGLAVAASILKRRPHLDVTVIEPRDIHYYQPGWTLVGGGVFNRDQTKRPMASVIPLGAKWVQAAVAEFKPEDNAVLLENGESVHYKVLIAAPGLQLDWDKIKGLKETLGQNGVTSNYRFDLAPYTWELVRTLKFGRALFTQPVMPIKCAGAPQKAMYLACDAWKRLGVLGDIDVNFHTAGAVLFGVADYVPALMDYVKAYDAHLHFKESLVAVDGSAKTATFEVTDNEGVTRTETRPFDMIHVCPPQGPLDFMKKSPLGDAAGWVEVHHDTLQHVRYGNVFGLGDGCSAANAKTAAAVRKQAPVVALNTLAILDGKAPSAIYEGYGSCPLTVERGKVVLAEFGYGGKLQPTLPRWLIDGTKPTFLGWFLKEKLMPGIYFDLMLKGREWLAEPNVLSHAPRPFEVEAACDFDSSNRQV